MMAECEHKTTALLADEGTVTDDNGITHMFTVAELAALRERAAALEEANEKAYLAMVAMGNDLNWDMADYGYGEPYFFPVAFTEAMRALKEAAAQPEEAESA